MYACIINAVELSKLKFKIFSKNLKKYCIIDYGNTGCEVFKRGVQNSKGFCLRINILKGNYSILRIGLVGASEGFKNQSFRNQLFSSSHSPN